MTVTKAFESDVLSVTSIIHANDTISPDLGVLHTSIDLQSESGNVNELEM